MLVPLHQREDWDTAALHAFSGRSDIDRDTAVDLFLDVAGTSFARYARMILPSLSWLVRESEAHQVTNLVFFYADYYRLMARAMAATSLSNLPGWEYCLTSFEAITPRDRGAIFVTFQFGVPLLIPHLVVATRPTTVLMHSRNSIARSFVMGRSSATSVRDVVGSKPFDLLQCLARGDHLFANVDTAYPGTRRQNIAFLNGALDIPAGLLDLIARRSNAQVFAIALGYRETTGLYLQLREIGASPAPYQALAEFFEAIVRAEPYQWMGWGSLQPHKRVGDAR